MTASALAPLTLAIPLLAAAVLAATQSVPHRLISEGVALGAAVASTAVCALELALAIRHGEAVYWFGGWQPRHGVALGISFAIDPFGAGLACFGGLLTIAALVFSWRHFEAVGHAFPALMLVFMTAIMGFCLSGDLFNMFVFFELMTVAGIGLTAHRSDQRAPLQGALNFGITNSIGGFLVLFGIALLYGRTGALNLAQIGVALSHHRVDGLVAVAFGLIVVGFLVKAAIVPFHFWLADAYASAPTPVCVIFAGVMSELGLYGVARVYWTVFAGPLGPHAAALRAILVVAGAITALLGAIMCLLQDRLKRLLAFATISYMGLFLIGIGLLDTRGLAGTAIYIVADGLLKASLFLCVGILQHRRGDPDSLRLRGLGRGLPYTGAVFLLAALGLAAVPGWGSFLGKSLIESAAATFPGYGWVPAVVTAVEILIGAAAIAAAARAFLGWGPALHDDVDESEQGEEEISGPPDRTPAVLFGPAVVLLLGSLAIGVLPGVGRLALAGAQRFEATSAYTTAVLSGHVAALRSQPVATSPTLQDVLSGIGFTIVTLLVGLLVVLPRRLPGPLAPVLDAGRSVTRRLHSLHSGHPGDYIAWLTVGAVIFTATFAFAFG
ncbi:MAG: complex I subunit 5 family protein [Solirubrobacteraceae bacterium]